MRYSLIWIFLLLLCAACESRSPEYYPSHAETVIAKYESVTVEERLTPFNSHIGKKDFAISPDGRYLVVPFPYEAVNQLHIVNLRTLEATAIQHTNENYKLHQPSYSPDGEWIAFVATPAPFGGISTIVIVTNEGEFVAEIGEYDRYYSSPNFSKSKGKLLYFRDSYGSFRDSKHNVSRAINHVITDTIFEYDFSTGTERQMVDLGWGAVDWVDFSGDGSSVVARALTPLGRHEGEVPERAAYLARYGHSIFDGVDAEDNAMAGLMRLKPWPPDDIRFEIRFQGYKEYPEFWSISGGYFTLPLTHDVSGIPVPLALPPDFNMDGSSASIEGVYSGYLLFQELHAGGGSRVFLRKVDSFEKHPQARELELDSEIHVSATMSENGCVFGSYRYNYNEPSNVDAATTIVVEDLCGHEVREVRLEDLTVVDVVTIGKQSD